MVPPGEVASPFFSADPAVPAPCVLASLPDGGDEPIGAWPVVPFFIALPRWLSVVAPFIESPVVVLLAAGPPAVELPPAVFPADCASANELVKANAVASKRVRVLMVSSRPNGPVVVP